MTTPLIAQGRALYNFYLCTTLYYEACTLTGLTDNDSATDDDLLRLLVILLLLFVLFRRSSIVSSFWTASPIFLTRHCHSHNTGRKLHRSKSGHSTSRKTICVSSWHCQSIKSDSLLTPLVRTSRSIGGSDAVYMCEVRVSGVMSSGEGYCGGDCFCLSGVVSPEEVMSSCWRVVDVDTDERSWSRSCSEKEEDRDVVLEEGDCRPLFGCKYVEGLL